MFNEDSTSEAHDSACLDFGFDEVEDEEDEYPDEVVEEDDDEPDLTRPVRDYRPSPMCSWPPVVKMLAARYRDETNEILNMVDEALSDRARGLSRTVLVRRKVVDHFGYERVVEMEAHRLCETRSERIYYGRCLTAEGELQAVLAEIERSWAVLRAALAGATGDMPKAAFERIDHMRRDHRLLIALAACHPERIWSGWWRGRLAQMRQAPEMRSYFRARDAMRRGDPEEQAAARRRDARRRKTRTRKEYMAGYGKAYRSKPEAKARDAARKRAARAAKKASAAPEVGEAAE